MPPAGGASPPHPTGATGPRPRSGFPMLVTRFAPSPTGYLHLGHAYAALTARAAGERFLLRLEDIDRQRCRDDFAAAILEDLAWLGLTWEQPVRRQSEHMDIYRDALAKLQALGVIYPCFCSRKDIAAAGQAPQGPEGPLYPGTCRTLPRAEAERRMAAGLPHALRLDTAAARRRCGPLPLQWHDRTAGLQTAQPERLGDPVLARRDTPTSYHLSVVVDDALQGVTLVTRGEDLFAATHLHRLLQALLNLSVPAYFHHPLLADPAGRRLAKRDGATSLRALRAAGHSAAEVRAMAGHAPTPPEPGAPSHPG